MYKLTFAIVFSIISHSTFAQTPQSTSDVYNAEWRASYFKNSKNGIGIYTGQEMVFPNNARKFSNNPTYIPTAVDFFEHLIDYTNTNSCIPKITFAGHGWSNPEGGGGLPMGNAGAGLYTNLDDKRIYGDYSGFAIFRSSRARTLRDFERLVRRKQIKFCDRCLVQIHACNIEEEFGLRFAKASGCQVITSAGKTIPVDTRDGSLDHVWISTDDESDSYSGFYRFTPTPDRRSVITERIGINYTAQ